MINSVAEFIERVAALTYIQAAYDVFEYEVTEDVRGDIYAMADPASPEPFRSAMHNIGFTHY